MGFAAFSRRQRRLALTALVALAFTALALVVVALSRGQEPAYRPGEKLEGLTSELSRSLPPDYPHVTFVDVTREAGIQFQHFSGERTSQLPEDMGSGVAWGDYDNDGWPDLFLVNAVGPLTLTADAARRSPAHCALYRNNHDGTFTDVTETAGVGARVWGMGAEWGDYDNDGWIDLVVSTYGENLLYHNSGDGTFSDRTRAAHLGGVRGFWSGVAWGDYDRDGFLDLYVTGYVRYSRPSEPSAASTDVENPAAINPNVFPPERNLLYHNNRDGTFTEVARPAGVLGERGKSLEAAWADFDEDGWPDLYVANDVTDNQLFRNRHDGTFEDVSHQAHVADYRSAMGLAIGDWDGDQDADMYITHWIAQENALYDNTRNAGPAMDFTDVADRFGLGQISLDFVGWGTFFFDYDNDGRLDLFEANGHTFQRRDAPRLLAPQTDQLFWNRSNRDGFYDVSAVSGAHFHEPRVGRGAAFADYDNDGDLDILVMQHGGPAMLLRNDGGNHRRWLNVKVGGGGGGAGARIRVVVGARVMVREVGAQASYLSQNDPTEHFGLDTTSTVDSVVVVWPNGTRHVSTNLNANQTLTVVKGTSARADIREFWERFREATRLRIAGSHAAAQVAYTRALELNPRHEDALYYLGNTELELGHYREALAAWERLVAVNAASARAHSRLGDLYLCGDPGAPRDLAKAEAEFQRAAEINREETGPLLRLGELALIRSRPADATRYLDAVIGSHARSVEAHLLKGYLAWKQEQEGPATALFHTAVTLAQSTQTAPAIARISRCRIFEAQVEGLPTASMNDVYGRLDRRRAELAPQ